MLCLNNVWEKKLNRKPNPSSHLVHINQLEFHTAWRNKQTKKSCVWYSDQKDQEGRKTTWQIKVGGSWSKATYWYELTGIYEKTISFCQSKKNNLYSAVKNSNKHHRLSSMSYRLFSCLPNTRERESWWLQAWLICSSCTAIKSAGLKQIFCHDFSPLFSFGFLQRSSHCCFVLYRLQHGNLTNSKWTGW